MWSDFFLCTDPLHDHFRAFWLDDAIFRPLDEGCWTRYLGQPALEFGDHELQLVEAPNRHVAVIDVGMLRRIRHERLDALEGWNPAGEFISAMD